MPFQSGSTKILESMRRGYSFESYTSLISHIQKKIPGVTFTSDTIVGFPGETRDDFEQTLKLVKTIPYDNVFIFVYSFFILVIYVRIFVS